MKHSGDDIITLDEVTGMKDETIKPERKDFDNLFKTILHDYFRDALKIFLPVLHEAVDWGKPVELLDKELQKVTFDLEGGAGRVDMLAKVTLKNGEPEFVICHLELQQGRGGGDMPLRMYCYKEAIHLRYRKEPVGIAVLLNRRPQGEKTSYYSSIYGVEATYKYISVSVPDIGDETLLADENRIGLVLYSAKCAEKSGDDESEKFRYLRHISDMWNARGWNPHDKRVILEAANYLIRLSSKDYIRQTVEYVENLKMSREDREMYVSIFEEVYTERGMEKGMEKGMEEGAKAKAVEIAKNLLAEGVSPDVISRTSGLSLEEVRSLMN
ncbi:MAG: hypothetical protein LBM00_00520 [Deltaproteobacteria bacterium]|jgi:hypothetical protein|nr:hypothetical protein [Deltaproteobacteria bacterium]